LNPLLFLAAVALAEVARIQAIACRAMEASQRSQAAARDAIKQTDDALSLVRTWREYAEQLEGELATLRVRYELP
jgi:hypothetical protein